MPIKFTEVEFKEPTKEELEEEEKYWRNAKYYCPRCKKVTTFYRCPNCGKRFCSNHAEEETEGNWETGYVTYPICYHCGG